MRNLRDAQSGRCSRHRAKVHIGALAWIMVVGGSSYANESARLACPNGIVLHAIAPSGAAAEVVRLPSGLKLQVSGPIVTITGEMVREAWNGRSHVPFPGTWATPLRRCNFDPAGRTAAPTSAGAAPSSTSVGR